MASAELRGLARRALRRWPRVRLLLEPRARNTAAAVAWAAARIRTDPGYRDGDVMGVFPADHDIADAGAFARTLRRAAEAAAPGEHLVLVGILPTRPETAYGYLRLGPEREPGVYAVRRFLEKPEPAVARRLVRRGGHLWNAGMVVARPERVLEETLAHAPEVSRGLGALLRGDVPTDPDRLARAFARVRPISFDHAVLERTRRVCAVQGRFGWSDLGSWDALAARLPERGGNRVRPGGRFAALDAEGNLVWNATPVAVVLLGVRGLAVVATPDALLVGSLDRAQDVRRLPGALRGAGLGDLT